MWSPNCFSTKGVFLSKHSESSLEIQNELCCWLKLKKYIYIYTHIYIHTHTCMHIYIWYKGKKTYISGCFVITTCMPGIGDHGKSPPCFWARQPNTHFAIITVAHSELVKEILHHSDFQTPPPPSCYSYLTISICIINEHKRFRWNWRLPLF